MRWVQPNDVDYVAVASALEILSLQGTVLCYTSQNIAEFWNACTRPINRNGYGLSSEETDRRAKIFESRLQLLPDGLAVHEEWRGLIVSHHAIGVHVHDARLVAAMRVHGVKRMLTFNEKDFSRYRDIEAINPRNTPALRS